ncbi:hypothetical protein IE077_001075 [Cardiosporidium cionae]|uniref:HhH-GPD domain-containing protein n=1 Tax=Cardiosporidium cionae TaxID=476202 RepID=A0ABQ7JEL0_9APIC|nr:hypothetical protein IE077_001075 [Cardiosporidium cionae]|eukprot:KAF8822085.1 hypothetical protein IE077_001075 [Cardiosporidium cionae]
MVKRRSRGNACVVKSSPCSRRSGTSTSLQPRDCSSGFVTTPTSEIMKAPYVASRTRLRLRKETENYSIPKTPPKGDTSFIITSPGTPKSRLKKRIKTHQSRSSMSRIAPTLPVMVYPVDASLRQIAQNATKSKTCESKSLFSGLPEDQPHRTTMVADTIGIAIPDYNCAAETIDITVPQYFSLAQAICSYGFFCMRPNQWFPAKHNTDRNISFFRRKLRYGKKGTACCDVIVTQPSDKYIRIILDSLLTDDEDRLEVENQIRRVCRLDALSSDLTTWWEMNPEAKTRKYGRLFRSPTLWEDLVKTITICNTRWQQSCTMNSLLCDKVSSHPGSFPTPQDVVLFSTDELQSICKLGYRGDRVRRLAADICEGNLDLQWFEHPIRSQEEVYSALLKMHGFGPFAANNMLQLLGHFACYPFDSETVRHFSEFHKRKGTFKEIAQLAKTYYDKFHPFQFLAYWFELWREYERIDGAISTEWIRGSVFVL